MERPRILIADDDCSVLRILARTFEQDGFEVLTASAGDHAAAALLAQPFDVLISDIQMPGLSGRQLCAHVVGSGIALPSCVLIMTSRSETEAREWIAAYPGIAIVEKPVGPRQLLRMVKERMLAGVP